MPPALLYEFAGFKGIQQFEDFMQPIKMQPIDARIINNMFSSKTSVEIRDFLLPKLMSGKIRVPLKVKDDLMFRAIIKSLTSCRL